MRALVVLLALLSSAVFGETLALPEMAAKYHAMLIKRPKPGAICQRFALAWQEQGDMAPLRAFLENRAGNAKATTADHLMLGPFLPQQSEHDVATITLAKAQVRRSYGIESEVIDSHVKGLSQGGNDSAIMELMKSLITVCLEKPENEWSEFLANYPPIHLSQGQPAPAPGSPLDRIRRALNICGKIASADAGVWMQVVVTLNAAGFSPYNGYGSIVSQLSPGDLPAKSADLLAPLAKSPWLKNLPEFDPLQPGRPNFASAFEQFVSALQQKGKAYTAALVDALQRQQEKTPTLGASLIIGRLAELTPDMTIALQPQVTAFAALPEQRQDDVLKLVRSVWPSFDRDAAKSSDLAPFVASARRAKLAAVQKLLAAKISNDFQADDGDFERQLSAAVAEAIPVDPKLARQALEHGVRLILDRQAKGNWRGQMWYDGCNIASGMLEKICGTASNNEMRGTELPSLDSIGFALHICEQPHQRDYLCTFGEDGWRWGALMAAYWDRSGGYRDPRKATRALLTELRRALGDASPALLSEALLEFGKVLPRWYRRIVDDEAKKIAAVSGKLQAIAQELTMGIGLDQPMPASAAHLQQRLADPSLHPFIRASTAAVLLDRAASALSKAEVRQCVEAIIPLLENDWSGSSTIWGPMLAQFNQQPTSPVAEALAARLRNAWLHRARSNKLGPKSGQMLEPSSGIAPQILEVFARSPDPAQLRALFDGCPKAFYWSVESSLVLARHGRSDLLKEVFKSSHGELKGNTDHAHRAEKFHESDKDVAQVIDETFMDDTRLMQRARVYAITAPDFGPEPPTINRAQRLKLEAQRFVAEKAKDKKTDDVTVKHLIDSVPAAEVLVAALLPEIKMDDVVRRSASSTSSVDISPVLEVPITLALTGLSMGDDKAWRSLVQAMKAETSSSVWTAFSFRVATVIVAQVRHHGLAKGGPLIEAMRAAILASPANRDWLDELANTHLVLCLLSDRTQDFNDWRKALPKDHEEAATPRSSIWMGYCLDALPMKATDDGGKTVLALLADPWSREMSHTEINFEYRGRWPKRFDDESIRAHTAEILAADPGNLAALDAVMNAWTLENDTKPLLDAVKAVKPKCDQTKHAKAMERMEAIEREK